MSHYTYTGIIGNCDVTADYDSCGTVTRLAVTLDDVARVVLVSENLLLDLIRRANWPAEVVVLRDGPRP